MKLSPPDIKSKTLNKFPKWEKNKRTSDFLGGGVIQLGPFATNKASASLVDSPELLCSLFKSILVLNFSATCSILWKCSVYISDISDISDIGIKE